MRYPATACAAQQRDLGNAFFMRRIACWGMCCWGMCCMPLSHAAVEHAIRSIGGSRHTLLCLPCLLVCRN